MRLAATMTVTSWMRRYKMLIMILSDAKEVKSSYSDLDLGHHGS